MVKREKKAKISKVKRGNQQRNKLARQGKLKTRRHRKPVQKQTVKPAKPDAESEEEKAGSDDDAADMLRMVDDDDMAFLKTAVANRSYSLLNRIRRNVPKGEVLKGKRKAPENDNPVEYKYQQSEEQEAKKTRYLLPIKTKDGLIMQTEEVEDDGEEVEVKEKDKKGRKMEAKKEKAEDENSDVEYVLEDGEIPGLDVEQRLSEADLLAYREQLLNKRRMQIGLLASGLLESPETKMRNFKVLLAMLDEERPEIQLSVRKLVLLSLLELFKDLLPSYQIKHQQQAGVKVKKDTQRLQQFEKSLLKAYKLYLQQLERFSSALRRPRFDASARNPQSQRLGELALRCLGDLLTTHPYFNFARNVAQLLAAQLAHHQPAIRAIAGDALRMALRSDRRGELALHITRCIARLARARASALPPDALAPLLALRLKDINLDREKEEEMKQRRTLTHRQKLVQMSRSQRKHSRLQEQLDREMLEAKAEENKQTKHKLLTEVTKTVFTIYFRVLKSEPGSPLLSATLEGLAHFAHCINMDFYHDLVNALDQLLSGEQCALGLHERLLSTQTVFMLLSGQGEALAIDPQRFYTHLYACLMEIHAGRTSRELLPALRTAELALLGRRRQLSQQRVLAFAKRLGNLAPQQLAGGAVGCLGALRALLASGSSGPGGGLAGLLEPDPAAGEGRYQPDLAEPEYCCAGATALWELPLLARHYHPAVRRLARATCVTDPEAAATALPADLGHLKPAQLLQRFDCSEMAFRPPVPPPPPASAARRRPPAQLRVSCPELQGCLDQLLAAPPSWDPAFGEELLRPPPAATSCL